MKKIFAFLLAGLMLVLSGCGRTDTPPATTAPTLEPTAPPVTEPVEDPWTGYVPVRLRPETVYAQSPEGYRVFSLPSAEAAGNMEFDVSGCEVGSLYTYDLATGAMYLIAEDATSLCTTSQHIYYTLHADPTRLYRSQFTQATQEPVCQLDGPIQQAQYWGTDDRGQVVLLEGDNRIWLYDIAADASTLLAQDTGITNFTYLFADQYKLDEAGCALWWYARPEENAEGKAQIYFPESGLTLPGDSELLTTPPTPPEHRYATLPDGFTCFRYSGESLYQWPELDVSGCEVGSIYAYDEEADSLYLLASNAEILTQTSEHVYYRLNAEPNKLYRTVYSEGAPELVCELDGQIWDVCYWGSDSQGQVIILEDQKRVWCRSLATGDQALLLEENTVEWLDDYNYAWAYKVGQTGFALVWGGTLTPEDTYGAYIYYTESGTSTLAPW